MAEPNTPETDFGQGGKGPSKEQAEAAQKERAEKDREEKKQGGSNPDDPRQAGQQYPFARQTQSNPGDEWRMGPQPDYGADDYEGHGRLKGKIALITGGDSGIGRSAAFMFAKEGADLAIHYLNEDRDAEDTKKIIEAEGRKCILIRGDLDNEEMCLEVVRKTVEEYGRIDVLVNNAAFQGTNIKDISELSRERVERTFNVNIIAFFSIVKAAVDHMPPGSCIINMSSVAGFKGSPKILDYAATKGAIRQFTKGLAQMIMPSRGIRVNAVAPGPIWTPIQPSSFSEDAVEELGKGAPEQVLTVTGGDPTAS